MRDRLNAGGMLAGALTLWLLTYPQGWPIAALIVGGVGAFAVGRTGSAYGAWLIPGAIVVILAVLLVADLDGSYSDNAGEGLLGYSNARAALFAQGAIAAGMLASAARSRVVLAAAGAAALAFAIVPLLSGSVAATGALIAVGPLLLVPMRWGRAAIATCGVMLAVLLTGTLMLSAGVTPPEALARGLTERRLSLWGEAQQILLEAPIRGAGAGGFIGNSPTASSDADARWVHHEYLELGAEHGVVAGALALGIVAWLLVELARRLPVGGRPVLFGAGAVTLLGLHASVDYVAHFPAIPLVAALLAGAAAGSEAGAVHGSADTLAFHSGLGIPGSEAVRGLTSILSRPVRR